MLPRITANIHIPPAPLPPPPLPLQNARVYHVLLQMTTIHITCYEKTIHSRPLQNNHKKEKKNEISACQSSCKIRNENIVLLFQFRKKKQITSWSWIYKYQRERERASEQYMRKPFRYVLQNLKFIFSAFQLLVLCCILRHLLRQFPYHLRNKKQRKK